MYVEPTIDALGGRILGDEPLFGEDVAHGLLKLISGSSDLLILEIKENGDTVKLQNDIDQLYAGSGKGV